MSLIQYTLFHPVRVLLIVLFGSLLGLGAFYAFQLKAALDMVAVEEFDPGSARDAIVDPPPDFSDLVDDPYGQFQDPEPPSGSPVPDPRSRFPTAFGDPIPDGVFDSYLLLGTDASGSLADAIILALQPDGGGAPIMVSLPRDLYVWNLCRDRFSRLNEGLGGCAGTASSSELMAIMVEDYTGIPVDHLARINFGGFARLVDAMGGIQVCVDLPTRDLNSGLDIAEPGCHQVVGDMALAWVRSRHAEELVDGEWRAAGGSDFTRQARQQDVLFQLAGRAASFSSPTALVDRLSAVASSVRLDSGWSFGQAIATGWRYRGIDKGSVRRFSIDVHDFRSPRGAAVLVPDRTFTDELSVVFDLPGV